MKFMVKNNHLLKLVYKLFHLHPNPFLFNTLNLKITIHVLPYHFTNICMKIVTSQIFLTSSHG